METPFYSQIGVNNINDINIDIDDLYKIFGNDDVNIIYTMKFLNNNPRNTIIHETFNGKVYDMPSNINDIIDYSPFFQTMMDIFRKYHENLDIDNSDYEKNLSPIKLQIRIRRNKDSFLSNKDSFLSDHTYVIDYKNIHNIYV